MKEPEQPIDKPIISLFVLTLLLQDVPRPPYKVPQMAGTGRFGYGTRLEVLPVVSDGVGQPVFTRRLGFFLAQTVVVSDMVQLGLSP